VHAVVDVETTAAQGAVAQTAEEVPQEAVEEASNLHLYQYLQHTHQLATQSKK
jgi:hypothetical protein